jgi:hypothetical protein
VVDVVVAADTALLDAVLLDELLPHPPTASAKATTVRGVTNVRRRSLNELIARTAAQL